MRAGLSTIQQTLTPDAAAILNQSISEAARRNHGQTTPLHVAATLLSCPTGYLRQACIKSHPNSSHPLQCRALELCFSVALERLPTSVPPAPQSITSSSPGGIEPPISNALMAALKRAQAHQRRGCPEQQQQPLLAVKVELEQLIISILDDPSVSRVMREASFSSPAVKATIEQSLSCTTTSSNNIGNSNGCSHVNVSNNNTNSCSLPGSNSGGFGFGFQELGAVPVPVPVPVRGGLGSRTLYVNPKLQQRGGGSGGVGGGLQLGKQRDKEVKKVVDILIRTKKRNPVLVGELELEMVVKEVLRRVESRELGDGVLKDVRIVHLDKEFMDKGQLGGRIGELVEAQVAELGTSGGVSLDLGDLKWLVEQPLSFVGPGPGSGTGQQQVVTEAGRVAVAEMGKVLRRYGEGGRVWFIGTATCETYLRCKVYHPTMENDWDLQAVPIAARNPIPGMFPRCGSNGLLGSSMEPLSPLKGLSTLAAATPRYLSEKLDPLKKFNCCPQCKLKYERELAKILSELNRSSSEDKHESGQPNLPQWLRNAKSYDVDDRALDQTVNKDQELMQTQKILKLQKKWQDTCVQLHPAHYQSNVGSERIAQPPLSMTSLYNPNMLSRQPIVPKIPLDRSFGGLLQLNPALLPSQSPAWAISSPGSPVRTDLVLGRPKVSETTPEEGNENLPKDFLGLAAPKEKIKLHELPVKKLIRSFDTDSFKKLLKGLLEKVSWQQEAASAVATTITQCKLGNGKRQGAGSRGDIWLLFSGPDKVGKKKIASALSELVCGANPIMICLGSRKDDEESELSYRGKTVLDQIADAARRNPFSVIMLDGIDEADMLVGSSIKQAIERGRLADSHGREISLGNVIFILTANWLPDNLKFLSNGILRDENKLASLASGNWQLRLSLCEKTAKRRAHWLQEEDRPTKPKKDLALGLSFDLNEAAGVADDKVDGSYNSSDLTTEREDEPVLNRRLMMPATSSVSRELLNFVDDNIVFKPVDFGPIRRDISNAITEKFATMIGNVISLEIQEEALEKIVGGVWLGRTGLEEWTDKALVPSIHQLRSRLPASSTDLMVARLEIDNGSNGWRHGEVLPSSIRVAAAGL